MSKHQEIIDLDDDDDENDGIRNYSNPTAIFNNVEEEELYMEYESPKKDTATTATTTTTTTTTASSKTFSFDSDIQTPQKSQTKKQSSQQKARKQPPKQTVSVSDSDSDSEDADVDIKYNSKNNSKNKSNNNSNKNSNKNSNNNNSNNNSNKNSISNPISINNTPIKRRKEDDSDEKKKKKKKQHLESPGQTSIEDYLEKSSDQVVLDDSLVNTDDEKDFETTFTLGKPSKKPVPPKKKSSAASTTTSTTTATSTRIRRTKYSNEEAQLFLNKGPLSEDEEEEQTSRKKVEIEIREESGEELESEKESEKESDEELEEESEEEESTSTSEFKSSGSESTGGSSASSSKRSKKNEKVTEKSLRSESFIQFDNSFQDIPNHSKDFIEPLKEQGIDNIEYGDNGIEYSIRFFRKKENQSIVFENFIIIFAPVEKFVDSIIDNQAIDYVRSIRDKNPGANYTLMIECLDRCLKNRSKEYRERLQKNIKEKTPIDTKSVPERATINKLFIDIQLTFGFTIKTIDERCDIISILSKYYDLIVKRPLRVETPLFTGFCAASIKKKIKDLSLTDIWMKQLSQITGISSNIAKSIVTAYPTISSLYSKYNSLPTREEKEIALKDIKLDTNGGQRNLGEVLSIRIYNVFNSTDPKKVVNL